MSSSPSGSLGEFANNFQELFAVVFRERVCGRDTLPDRAFSKLGESQTSCTNLISMEVAQFIFRDWPVNVVVGGHFIC